MQIQTRKQAHTHLWLASKTWLSVLMQPCPRWPAATRAVLATATTAERALGSLSPYRNDGPVAVQRHVVHKRVGALVLAKVDEQRQCGKGVAGILGHRRVGNRLHRGDVRERIRKRKGRRGETGGGRRGARTSMSESNRVACMRYCTRALALRLSTVESMTHSRCSPARRCATIW